ncbi:MAG: [FeFe] hydrogenase H-cluster maturation GTPase HydF [Candidatus Omnitrophica bacterium]|nr:[FeFe] hydrogenase H-cluster maturation GTPase HydF [Candidatus Omnitrophota bacterium]
MQTTPKSLRIQIGIFGRTNVGKSSFLNMISGQDVAITSPVPGTTTDVVEKPMELLPLGPVVFLDSAGLDDMSVLGELRVERTMKALDRSDVALFLVEANVWSAAEENIVRIIKEKKKPFAVIVNKTDAVVPTDDFLRKLSSVTDKVLCVSSVSGTERNTYLNAIKQILVQLCPEDLLMPKALIGDLLPPGGLVVMVVPIDLQAPKGRLILPQVQAMRDVLDHDAAVLVVKEREYAAFLRNLKEPPALVVCDSQVVMKVVADTPPGVKCTTFSILFARFKGDLIELARGAARIGQLKAGDRVLIAESCTHHAAEDDIGRVKIPRWLRQYVGCELTVDHYAGRDYPKDLEKYQLIVHCGSCMLTRGEMMLRIQQAKERGVPVTNYGVAISFVQGVLKRALGPFPAALSAFESVSH